MYRLPQKTNEAAEQASGLARPSVPSALPAVPGTFQFARSLGNQAVKRWVDHSLQLQSGHPIQREEDKDGGLETMKIPAAPAPPIATPNFGETQSVSKATEKVLIEPKETVVESSTIPTRSTDNLVSDVAPGLTPRGTISMDTPPKRSQMPVTGKVIPTIPHNDIPDAEPPSLENAEADSSKRSFTDVLTEGMDSSTAHTASEQETETESRAPSFSEMLSEQIEETREE